MGYLFLWLGHYNYNQGKKKICYECCKATKICVNLYQLIVVVNGLSLNAATKRVEYVVSFIRAHRQLDFVTLPKPFSRLAFVVTLSQGGSVIPFQR